MSQSFEHRAAIGAAVRASWARDPGRNARHVEAVRAGKRRAREARLSPWVDRLEQLVCPEGEEFDDAGRAAAAAFLCDLVDECNARRSFPPKPEGATP